MTTTRFRRGTGILDPAAAQVVERISDLVSLCRDTLTQRNVLIQRQAEEPRGRQSPLGAVLQMAIDKLLREAEVLADQIENQLPLYRSYFGPVAEQTLRDQIQNSVWEVPRAR
ncbi:MAG: hypothetical protein IRY99_08390 [Isosphaeraceae bacterium]|nr:hypothetical protein [Isosphaeraceae bacterium]